MGVGRMTPDNFVATIDDWIKQTKERQVGVFRESSQRLISKMQGRIPIATGYARASIRVSLESMPQINPMSRGERGGSYTYDGSEAATTIAGATLDDAIYVGYTASYVQYLEYGHSKQAPTGFVGISAMEWPQIVAEVSDELKARVG